MAAKKASLAVNVIADVTNARAGFKQAEQAAGSLGNQLKKVGTTVAATFATKAIVDFAKSSINAASNLNESINAVQVTFGEAADGILKFGQTASKTVGMSANDFNGFAVQFAGFTKQIATADKDIVEVTTELTTRIADFASVMNLDIPQAAQVFQSSLAGQTEPIRRFGIDLSAAAVAAFAVEQGIVESASAMTEADKVQARYLLLMQETEKTAGDFANTSDSLANSQRILKADFENMQAEVGKALLPVMQELVNIVRMAVDIFASLPTPVQKVITLTAVLGGGMATASRALQGFGMSAATANKAVGALGAAMLLMSLKASKAAEQSAAYQEALINLTKATDDQLAQQLGTAIFTAAMAGEFKSAEHFTSKLAESSIGLTERLRDLGLLQEFLGLTTEKVNEIIQEQIGGFQQAEKDAKRTAGAIDGLTAEQQDAAEAAKAHSEAIAEQEKALNNLVSATLSQFNAALGYESQQWRTKDAVDAYTETLWQAITGEIEAEDATRAIAEAQNSAASAALNQAAAAAKLAEEQAEMRGETLSAADAALIQIRELEKVASTLDANNPLRKQLQDYMRQLGAIPTEIGTIVSLRVRDETNVFGRLTPQMQMRAKGGPVSPTMGPYIVGEEGPEVFVPGQTGMILPNTALIDAMATRPTAAGLATQPTVIVNVQGSVTSERDLVESIRQGLLDSQRSGRRVVLS